LSLAAASMLPSPSLPHSHQGQVDIAADLPRCWRKRIRPDIQRHHQKLQAHIQAPRIRPRQRVPQGPAQNQQPGLLKNESPLGASKKVLQKIFGTSLRTCVLRVFACKLLIQRISRVESQFPWREGSYKSSAAASRWRHWDGRCCQNVCDERRQSPRRAD